MTTNEALQRVAKWRALFAGWHLGTRPKGDPASDAMRDLRELTILLRVEVTALTKLLLDKGVFTAEELDRELGREAELLNHDYERRFPGVTAHEHGLTFDGETIVREGWMAGWLP